VGNLAAVNDLGYVSVRWTVVLMHVGSHPEERSTLDADALPAVISSLRDRGHGFVTLDALR
jgi:peptidoglycan/xylan/chitin deacetylase (PgdA/CDA1 family)